MLFQSSYQPITETTKHTYFLKVLLPNNSKNVFQCWNFRELLPNNTTNFFRNHINQLLNLPRELLPNNTKHSPQCPYQTIITLSESFSKLQTIITLSESFSKLQTLLRTRVCSKSNWHFLSVTTKYYWIYFTKYF